MRTEHPASTEAPGAAAAASAGQIAAQQRDSAARLCHGTLLNTSLLHHHLWFILASPQHHISQSLLYLNESERLWNGEGKKREALCATVNSFLPRLISGEKTKLSFCWNRSCPRYRLGKLPLRNGIKRVFASGSCWGEF